MNLGLENKVCIITGSSRGIGEGIANSLLQEGAIVYGISRSKEISIKHKNLHQLTYDLSSEKELKNLISYTKKNDINPDILINNVGGNLEYTDPLESSKGWDEVSFLNLKSSMILNEAFIPHMIQQKWGRICHISSISSLENQGPPIYCAAKAALNAYVRSLGRYVSEHNVILTTVLPGAIFTENGYWDKASKERPDHVKKYVSERMAIKRFGIVSEVSELVAVMVSEKSSFCPGTSLLIDGGQGRVFQ